THSNGYETLYGHLSKIMVSEGDSVTKKDKIGLMGNTGRSTGSHLHLEVIKNEKKLNPLNYVR
ncbi:MAG TPA: peptidase, partial [Clostridiales bacterium]|nr:peptidase [Clostridiales bacterium]